MDLQSGLPGSILQRSFATHGGINSTLWFWAWSPCRSCLLECSLYVSEADMAQHFLLSAAARTLSIKVIFSEGEDAAYQR